MPCHPFCSHPHSVVPFSCHEQLPSRGVLLLLSPFFLHHNYILHHQRLHWLISSTQPGTNTSPLKNVIQKRTHACAHALVPQVAKSGDKDYMCTQSTSTNMSTSMEVTDYRVFVNTHTQTNGHTCSVHLIKYSNISKKATYLKKQFYLFKTPKHLKRFSLNALKMTSAC